MDADHSDFLLIIYLCTIIPDRKHHIDDTNFILWVCSVMQATIQPNRKHSSKCWISLKTS